LRVVVVGSGGIGGFLGGALAKSGEDVVFLARGKHLEALKRDGLKVESVALGKFNLKIKATDKPTEIGLADLVLFCVKCYDTETALLQIAPMIGKDTTVLTFQNGVDNEERIGKVLGSKRVMLGTISVESYIAEPGKIVQAAGPWRIAVGEEDGSITSRGKAIHESLLRAGLSCELSDRIRELVWEKFLFICATAGICSVSRSSIGEVLGFRATRDLYLAALKEIEGIARAKGFKFADGLAAKRTLAQADAVNKSTKPSMLRDLEKGNRVEVDALNGAVSRFGRELSIPTPVNDFIYGTLKVQDLAAARRMSLS